VLSAAAFVQSGSGAGFQAIISNDVLSSMPPDGWSTTDVTDTTFSTNSKSPRMFDGTDNVQAYSGISILYNMSYEVTADYNVLNQLAESLSNDLYTTLTDGIDSGYVTSLFRASSYPLLASLNCTFYPSFNYTYVDSSDTETTSSSSSSSDSTISTPVIILIACVCGAFFLSMIAVAYICYGSKAVSYPNSSVNDGVTHGSTRPSETVHPDPDNKKRRWSRQRPPFSSLTMEYRENPLASENKATAPADKSTEMI
jgi:hypothetical protein